jgi:hypothetical protein
MTKPKLTKLPIVPESPARLRDCLTAMSKHLHLDVVRVELAFKSDGSIVVIATHSGGEAAEERMATAVCQWIASLSVFEDAIPDTEPAPPDPRDEEIARLRAELANLQGGR